MRMVVAIGVTAQDEFHLEFFDRVQRSASRVWRIRTPFPMGWLASLLDPPCAGDDVRLIRAEAAVPYA